MLFSQLQNPLGIDDRRVDLQAVANDACICQKARDLLLVIVCNFLYFEIIVCFSKVLSFLQDRDPGKSGLVDLEDEPLEQQVIIPEWKAILSIMIDPVERIFGVRVAVVAVSGHKSIVLLLQAAQGVPVGSRRTHPSREDCDRGTK